ncbi:tRNA (5-methylaminomethyl-2-thiouridine)(34)-methyltransferase MnmD [Orbaceae bacterium ESL0721]|nr:tRNA (5-methylaminomethyl-2-thiouridine)(34)-methyltransferase MnmD [Orbaceae bacterium ESL0721]
MNSAIIWDEKAGVKTPRSRYFDDVYFNSDGGIAESEYVFVEGNRLYDRFLTHPRETFIIAETGFGTGLNFLLVWQLFLSFKAAHPTHILQKLQFYSVEKYPLPKEDLIDIYAQFTLEDDPILTFVTQLQQNWGADQFKFGDVAVEILFNDVTQFPHFLSHKLTVLDKSTISHNSTSANNSGTKQDNKIDAWFFDGFSPTKNPDMWSATLFKACYQLTHLEGTFATFSAASAVRRNLEEAGFVVTKRKGYGVKREMLIGIKNN